MMKSRTPMGLFAWALALCLCQMAAQAQISLFIDTLSADTFPEIRAKIRVLENGTAVGGLTVGNFTVFEDGRIQQPVAGYCLDTAARNDLSVLLVIDRSSSMGQWPYPNSLKDAKTAAKNFVTRMQSTDEFALVSFSETWTEDQSWTSDKILMNTKIEALTPYGNTALWDAVYHGADMLATRSKKRIMIVLTDGTDNRSTRSFVQALNSVVAKNVIVYAIGLGFNIETAELTQMATMTKGKFYTAPSSSDLDQIYANISQQFLPTGVCELRYASRLDCLDGSRHVVEIVVNSGGREARATASYTLPRDTTTFSYVHLAMQRDHIVEAADSIHVPILLTRVSAARPSAHYAFHLGYDTTLVTLDSLLTTALTRGFLVAMARDATGAAITLSGVTPITVPGLLLTAVFRARNVEKSGKSEIEVSPPEAGTACTIASSSNGLITVSGTCERALAPSSHSVAPISQIGDVHPNPFTPGTWIEFSFTEPSTYQLDIQDILGRCVVTLGMGRAEKGSHRRYFDAGTLPAGWYFVRLSADDRTTIHRVLLVR